MISKQQTTIAEVARLTGAGRLDEAVSLLKGHILGGTTVAPIGADTDRGSASAEPRRPALSALQPNLRELADTFGRFVKSAALRERSPPPVRGAEGVAAPDRPRFDDRHFSNAAGRRAYKLYRPAREASEPLPLVVMLHGCQQSSLDFAAGTRMNVLAEELGFIVAYPEQSSFANQSRCWNWFAPGDQGRDAGEPSLIAGITRQIMQDAAVDPSRVYIAGLSAGGAAAAILGSTYPDLYTAVCVHSGLACGAARDMSSAFSAMQGGGSSVAVLKNPRPTIVFHGDRDHTVNSVNGDQVIRQSLGGSAYTETITQGRSAAGMAYTRTVHRDKAGRSSLEQWVLHGLGHAWSGGSPEGSFTDPRGPDASREMMRFFLEHAT